MPVRSRSVGRPEGALTESSTWDVSTILGFLHRQGEGKPRLSDWGNQFQLRWKVQLFPREAPGWTHFMVHGNTIEDAVSQALQREYNESRTFLVVDTQEVEHVTQ